MAHAKIFQSSCLKSLAIKTCFMKHEKHPLVNSKNCSALSFWDPLLLLTLFSISHDQGRGGLPIYSGLLIFFLLDIKLPGMRLFLWVIDEYFVK